MPLITMTIVIVIPQASLTICLWRSKENEVWKKILFILGGNGNVGLVAASLRLVLHMASA